MNGVFYLISLVVFAVMLRDRPWILLRPSMWVLLAMLVRINGAAAFGGADLDIELNAASSLRLATMLFPFLVFVWVGATGGVTERAREIYVGGLGSTSLGSFGAPERTLLRAFGTASLVVMAAYLIAVPIQKSGLVAILTNPAASAGAREESLKLIAFAPLRYAYLWHMEILAPVLAVLVVFGMRARPFGRALLKWSLLGALFLSVMMSGARGPAGSLMLAIGVGYLLRNGVVKGGRALAGAVGFAVLLALVMSILRDGRLDIVSPSLLWKYLSDGLFVRVCVTPYETGVMTNMYAEQNGLLGVSNIRPLALLFGKPFVFLPNAVGLSYMYAKVSSVSANTSFLFDLQASFGIWPGWAVSGIALCVLDFLILAYRRLNGLVLVAFYATFFAFLQALVSSAYTTTLITHGVVPTSMLAALWARRHVRVFASRDGRGGR